MKTCKTISGQVNPLDLPFATKFVAVYFFIKVKGSRPMTYQYLTVDMVRKAKENGGFINHKQFKTDSKYGFDSLILTDTSMKVLESYIDFVRPLLKPQCDFVLVTRNGGQRSELGDVMSKLVFDAIGKYIIQRVIVKLSKARSNEFFQKTKNTVLPLQKFTIKSRDRAELLSRPTSVYGGYKARKVRRWIGKCTRGLVVQPEVFQHQSKQQNQRAQWTTILRDPKFKFQTGRVADALKKRAELKFLSN